MNLANLEVSHEEAQAQARRLWDQMDADEAATGAPGTERSEEADPAARERAAEAEFDMGGGAPAPAAAPAPSTPRRQEPAAAPAAAPATAAAATVPEAAGMPDDPNELRNLVIGQRLLLDQLTNRVRNAEGRLGTLNQQVKRTSTTAPAPNPAAPGPAPAVSPEALDAILRDAEKVRDQYPDIGGPMLALAEQLRSTMAARTAPPAAPEVSPPDTAPEPQGPALDVLVRQTAAEMACEFARPGFKATVESLGFRGWLHTQPAEIQALASSDNPTDAVKLVNLYQPLTPPAPPPPARTGRSTALASAAALPSGRRGGAADTTKRIEELTDPKAIWAALDEQENEHRR